MEDIANVDASSLSSGDAKTLISSAIAGLNADDIESFQILKGGFGYIYLWCSCYGGCDCCDNKEG